MTRKNRTSGIAGLIAVLLGFFCKAFYRDFVNINDINDYGMAGFLPSYFYVIGLSLLLLIRPTQYPKIIIGIVTAASILFELKQWNTSGNFDLPDMLASIAGGLTSVLILNRIERINE